MASFDRIFACPDALLSASRWFALKSYPVFGEPTGTVPAKAGTAAKTTATVAAKNEAASKPVATAKAEETSKSACNRDTFHVVIDVGHTASKPGAISARGVYEYEFNLKLATLIDKKLHDAGFAKSVLLITKDVSRYRAGLFKRAERARAMKADLFLSVHHDSVPDRFFRSGNTRARNIPTATVSRVTRSSFRATTADYRDSLMFGEDARPELKDRGLKYTPHYVEKFMGHPAAYPGRRRRRRVSV